MEKFEELRLKSEEPVNQHIMMKKMFVLFDKKDFINYEFSGDQLAIKLEDGEILVY